MPPIPDPEPRQHRVIDLSNDVEELPDAHKPRLTLNLTLSVVEALIGGDTAAAFDIRQQVVNAFTKKYLKGVVRDDVFQRCLTDFKVQCNEHLQEILKPYIDRTIPGTNWLTEAVRARLERAIDIAVGDVMKVRIRNYVETQLAEKTIQELIDKRIEHYLDREIKQKINEGVKARMLAVQKAAEG